MKKICGIDPGKQGSIALFDGEEVRAIVMPVTNDNEIDGKVLHAFFSTHQFEISKAFIEMPGMRLRENPNNALKIGIGFGKVIGALMANDIPFEIVHPLKWSNCYPHGVIEKERNKRQKLIKQARAEILRGMFPGVDFRASSRAQKFHEGIVDAVLLADYGYNITYNNKEK